MEELETLYDNVKYYKQGSLILFIDPVEKLSKGFYIVDRCVDHFQPDCRHDIKFTKISANIYYSDTISYSVEHYLDKKYSKNRYILLHIDSVNNPEENDTKTYTTETD